MRLNNQKMIAFLLLPIIIFCSCANMVPSSADGSSGDIEESVGLLSIAESSSSKMEIPVSSVLSSSSSSLSVPKNASWDSSLEYSNMGAFPWNFGAHSRQFDAVRNGNTLYFTIRSWSSNTSKVFSYNLSTGEETNITPDFAYGEHIDSLNIMDGTLYANFGGEWIQEKAQGDFFIEVFPKEKDVYIFSDYTKTLHTSTIIGDILLSDNVYRDSFSMVRISTGETLKEVTTRNARLTYDQDYVYYSTYANPDILHRISVTAPYQEETSSISASLIPTFTFDRELYFMDYDRETYTFTWKKAKWGEPATEIFPEASNHNLFKPFGNGFLYWNEDTNQYIQIFSDGTTKELIKFSKNVDTKLVSLGDIAIYSVREDLPNSTTVQLYMVDKNGKTTFLKERLEDVEVQ